MHVVSRILTSPHSPFPHLHPHGSPAHHGGSGAEAPVCHRGGPGGCWAVRAADWVMRLVAGDVLVPLVPQSRARPDHQRHKPGEQGVE